MNVRYGILPDKLEIRVGEHSFCAEYPKEVWSEYPEDLKKVCAESLAYMESFCLPFLAKGCDEIDFDFGPPLFRSSLFDCFYRHLPVCADVDKMSTDSLINKLLAAKHTFRPVDGATPAKRGKRASKGRAIVPFSFGKESLLTYSLALELGLDPEPVLSMNKCSPLEMKHLSERADAFSKELKTRIWRVSNGLSEIGDYDYWGMPETEIGNTVVMTEYFFYMLPLADHIGADYILLGCESSCNDNYINKDGYITYPVFDQSRSWLLQLTKMWQTMSGPSVHATSLVEPLYELAIVKMLHNRYPKIGKYQLSCFPDFSPHGANRAWCQDCSKCARIFVMMKANELDPKAVGFTENMFNKEYRKFYSLFGLGDDISKTGYDMSGCNRGEELYAFYLAYKNGARGELLDEFKKLHLKEAVAREDELHDTYLGIHDSKTIPSKVLKPLVSIYKEELSR